MCCASQPVRRPTVRRTRGNARRKFANPIAHEIEAYRRLATRTWIALSRRDDRFGQPYFLELAAMATKRRGRVGSIRGDRDRVTLLWNSGEGDDREARGIEGGYRDRRWENFHVERAANRDRRVLPAAARLPMQPETDRNAEITAFLAPSFSPFFLAIRLLTFTFGHTSPGKSFTNACASLSLLLRSSNQSSREVACASDTDRYYIHGVPYSEPSFLPDFLRADRYYRCLLCYSKRSLQAPFLWPRRGDLVAVMRILTIARKYLDGTSLFLSNVRTTDSFSRWPLARRK